jgi:hypothetical protein
MVRKRRSPPIAGEEAQVRYARLLAAIRSGHEVWSLWADGWATAASSSGRSLAPVWPDAESARACAAGAWAGYTPRSVPLDAWLERWTAGLARDGRAVAAFPTPAGRGIEIEPERFAEDLRREDEGS